MTIREEKYIKYLSNKFGVEYLNEKLGTELMSKPALSYEEVLLIIKTEVDLLISMDYTSKAYSDFSSDLHLINGAFRSRHTQKEINISKTKCKKVEQDIVNICYDLLDIDSIIAHVQEYLIPHQEFETAAYLMFYCDIIDSYGSCDEYFVLPATYFYKAGEYGKAKKICSGVIAYLEDYSKNYPQCFYERQKQDLMRMKLILYNIQQIENEGQDQM